MFETCCNCGNKDDNGITEGIADGTQRNGFVGIPMEGSPFPVDNSEDAADVLKEKERLLKEIDKMSDMNIELERKNKRLSEESKPDLSDVKLNIAPSEATEESSKTGTGMLAMSRKLSIQLDPAAEEVMGLLKEEEEAVYVSQRPSFLRSETYHPQVNQSVIIGSVLALRRQFAILVNFVALAGVLFVFGAKASHLGDADHRRLGGGVSPLISNIAFSVAAAGIITFFINLLKLPLILGYLAGGIVVGPICLEIVANYEAIEPLGSLGLVFLMFMIGLELDVKGLFEMGRVVILTGAIQLPLCAGLMTLLFYALEAAGLTMGGGRFPALYLGVSCAVSSTMIVLKMLCQQMDMDTRPGRMTVSLLAFQDLWAIVLLTIQPHLIGSSVLDVAHSFGWLAVLIFAALAYAKYVMPPMFVKASQSVELMLVVALAWCFFLCCFGLLPFVKLSLQLTSLVAGAALATFPYSSEFNAKIQYIRDFFATLFIVGVGMRIPAPWEGVGYELLLKAFVASAVVLAIRWVSIGLLGYLIGSGKRTAIVATINLSQTGEFSVVLCVLGVASGHISEETLTIAIWTFIILALISTVTIRYNYAIYGVMHRIKFHVRARAHEIAKKTDAKTEDDDEDHQDRDIILMGFHKIAAMLVQHLELHSRTMLEKLHVITFDEDVCAVLRKRNIKASFGDIAVESEMRAVHKGEARLVIASIPDAILRGKSNLDLLQLAKRVWPNAHVIVTADTPHAANKLYEAGADYVLRVSKLCAGRLNELISEHCTHTFHHDGELASRAENVFEKHKNKDKFNDRVAHSLLFR